MEAEEDRLMYEVGLMEPDRYFRRKAERHYGTR
jgi:hypothetical protein